MSEVVDEAEAPPARQTKSAAAFKTISEVAQDLNVAQHVLRFWESKFPQVRPLKRGGGRRFYRPEDVAVLQQIRVYLYEQGYTIKGAQKLLRARRSTAAAKVPEAEAAPRLRVDGPSVGMPVVGEPRRRLDILRNDLQDLRELLRSVAAG